MFTGLIEQKGEVIANTHGEHARRLLIRAEFDSLQAGESIAVNGVCLTLLPDFEAYLAFDVSPETLKITTLGELQVGDCVNLERAMLATMRFGGHYVSGHVDTTVTLKRVVQTGDYIEMTLGGFEASAMRYFLPKGSIALDGVSLTINAVEDNSIKVLLVPHTIDKTTLGQRQAGEHMNVEYDYLTRIIVHQVESVVNLIRRP